MNIHDELPTEHEDALIAFLHKIIKIAVKVLAILMVLVIFWGVGDVVYVLYQNLMAPPFMLLSISDIFKTFAAFLVVLIAIEIYQNIVMYLRTDVIPIKLVVATALMAIARKVIIIDFSTITPMYIFATAAVVLALGITYYLIGKHHKEKILDQRKGATDTD
ncbi:phosphate-starvation-inducible PsiE family protein [Candidatus Sulfurimonas baltica]|uniref:Phosphate-starvation-inducible PsiE family protein n=1 Tax=Candidatus Sulfurimonas baltica TaxID=2740404 RepID=A0A7S7LTD7_9BACT|nr:phosphate-starvation-inducible PsiE family protein [Candidatus Sulfurimonas baltica]QOY50932.1 phosphate-starvation-inducible PsiE family protein [Candidatus Sulfurimonas baltica]QOY50977.1 phosphate-starvation-inducible PsiE family protein [Candidatus Sulfurimonas baltica]